MAFKVTDMKADKHPDLYREEDRQKFREIKEQVIRQRKAKMNHAQRRASKW